jgi:carbonic anhydrase/acetyltransferase-like protein (isoleucine patch superfamily)
MQIIVLATVLLFINYSLASTSSKCPGEEGYYFTNYKHRNPTQGGFVSNKADVQDTDDLLFIGPESAICGSSRISGKARIFGEAIINNASIQDEAEISENALIEKGATISGNARISGQVRIYGSVEVSGQAVVTESAILYNNDSEKLVSISGKARIAGSVEIDGDAIVEGSAKISGHVKLWGDVRVNGTAVLKGYTRRYTGTISSETISEPDYAGIAKAKEDELARCRKIAHDEELDRLAREAFKIAEALRVQEEAIRKAEERQKLERKFKSIRDKLKNSKFYNNNGDYEVIITDNDCVFKINSHHHIYNFDFSRNSKLQDRSTSSGGLKFVTREYVDSVQANDQPEVKTKYQSLELTTEPYLKAGDDKNYWVDLFQLSGDQYPMSTKMTFEELKFYLNTCQKR